MAFEAALVLRYGVEHAGHAVRYVVAHDAPHVPSCDHDAYHRIEKQQVVGSGGVEVGGEHQRYVVDERFQDQRGYSAEHAHSQGEYHYECLFLVVAFAPSAELLELWLPIGVVAVR